MLFRNILSCFPNMKYLTNVISDKNVVTELTTRTSETKTNLKLLKNCYISLFFIKSLAYCVSINLFTYQTKHIYRCNPFSIIIRSLLVCYCTCSLSLNTFAFKEIIYKNLKFKTSLNDTNITNPEKGRKQFSRMVASNANHLFLRNTLHHNTSIGLCNKNHLCTFVFVYVFLFKITGYT